MNLGAIWDEFDETDRIILMNCLSYNSSTSKIIQNIHNNRDYSKLIFIDIRTIFDYMQKELKWVVSERLDINLNDELYQVSRDNPDKVKKLVTLLEKKLK